MLRRWFLSWVRQITLLQMISAEMLHNTRIQKL